LFIVFVWPPSGDKSLALKITNWAVDPTNALPILPGPLSRGLSDDRLAVEAHDFQVRRYDDLYARGGWTRTRLLLKVADDPFNPATVRQLLLAFGTLVVFLIWRSGGRAS
jgi:hypothetical protein